MFSSGLLRAACIFVAAAGCVLGVCASAAPQAARTTTLSQLVGQHLLVHLDGGSPTPQFLGRIRRGEIGGVVLLGDNIGRSGPTGLIAQLQAAARAGGQPPLLIAIDQEGGTVRRLTIPPTLAPREMTSVSVAQSQGLETGRALRRLGVTVDVAPVLDVPTSTDSFIADRSFSFDANAVAARGVAFARGLLQGGVASTAKHFPGLGRLRQNTDFGAGRVNAS